MPCLPTTPAPCVFVCAAVRRFLRGAGREADRGVATIDYPFQLQDQNDNVIAFFRPTRPQRYNIGEVHGELHFVRNAGAGVVVRIPLLSSFSSSLRRRQRVAELFR